MNDLISKSALNEDLRAYADRKHMNGQTDSQPAERSGVNGKGNL